MWSCSRGNIAIPLARYITSNLSAQASESGEAFKPCRIIGLAASISVLWVFFSLMVYPEAAMDEVAGSNPCYCILCLFRMPMISVVGWELQCPLNSTSPPRSALCQLRSSSTAMISTVGTLGWLL